MICQSYLLQGRDLLDAVLLYLLEIANISLSGFSANLRWTTNTGLFFNYIDSYFYLFFFLADQDDKHTNDAIESIITDSDDCIVASPVSKNIKQVSWNILWQLLVKSKKQMNETF